MAAGQLLDNTSAAVDTTSTGTTFAKTTAATATATATATTLA